MFSRFKFLLSPVLLIIFGSGNAALAQVADDPDTSLLKLLLNRTTEKEEENDEEGQKKLFLGEEEPLFLDEDSVIEDSVTEDISFADFIFDEEPDSVIDENGVVLIPLEFIPQSTLPVIAFTPAVFDSIALIDPLEVTDTSGLIRSWKKDPFLWIMKEKDRNQRYRDMKQRFMIHNPEIVKYNLADLPEPPKQYSMTVDPSKSTITISEIIVSPTAAPEKLAEDTARKNWLHTFNGSLQFSQAYLSPNWYQGGNNNVNMIGNVQWNVKLNNRFHPKLIAEATTFYKLAMASAPQDTVHNYTISEDLFQFNGTLGLKAFNNWYYSLTGMFKTQFLKNYKTNSNDLKAAFMSPGELNIGIGMTYNKVNPKKTFSIDVSIAPLSYNLKISTHPDIDETTFGIHEGRHSVSEIGSNAEVKIKWDILWNVSFNSRLFLFSNYEYLQGDWQNTFNFSFNRYLSSQLYIHLRYDSDRPYMEGTKWHRWQLKEILSFGFQYQFKTI